jgi:TolA-binding protein
VNQSGRIFVRLSLAMGLLALMVSAQKPPAPAPVPAPSPSPTPGRSASPVSPSSQPIQPEDDRVLFLRGRVAISDGSAIPNDMLVERVCDQKVRQQVYAAPAGDFSMQLGSRADSYLDASGDPSSPFGVATTKKDDSLMGIPRRNLTNCELRASATGFHSSTVSLIGFTPYESSLDVGAIVLQRTTKVKGGTLSAVPYKAPANARKAFEKGLEAEKKSKLSEARRNFEEAVAIYPSFAIAWYQLGTILLKQSENDLARTAFTKATASDPKFLPPYLSLASMAYEAGDWKDVLTYTNYLLDRDPLNHAGVYGYLVDLDPMNYGDIYFYNAVANFRLNRLDDAEKSALKAEQHIDLSMRAPKLHLMLAEIFARKKDYAMAISETRRYLELAPHANDVDGVRERLAELERLNAAASTSQNK